MTETGLSAFNQKAFGAFAFGVLCALEHIGAAVDFIGASPESAVAALLYQKGFKLENGTELISRYENEDENFRYHCVKRILKIPDTRGVITAIWAEGRIFSQDEEPERVFGRGCEKIEDNIGLLINSAESDNVQDQKLIWLLNSLGARKIICADGGRGKTYFAAGKKPVHIFSPGDECEGNAKTLAVQGWRQTLGCREHLLNSIYFAV